MKKLSNKKKFSSIIEVAALLQLAALDGPQAVQEEIVRLKGRIPSEIVREAELHLCIAASKADD